MVGGYIYLFLPASTPANLLTKLLFTMSSTDEKENSTAIERVEDVNQTALSNDDYDEEFTPAEQRKIIHRIDRRLVTMTGLAYCISLMDRTNLSAAAIAG